MKTIFFGPKQSIVEKMLADIKNSATIEYNGFSMPELDHFGFRKRLFSSRVFKLLPNRAKKKMLRKLFGRTDFLARKSKEPVLIMFINSFELFGGDIFWTLHGLLKKTYPNAKFAFFYYAAIDFCYPQLFPKVREKFDLVVSFDRYSSEKYGTEFYGPINEKGIVEPDGDCEGSDVFFSGNHQGVSKGSSERMDLITDCLAFLADHQRKCIFYLDGCREEDKKHMLERMRSICADPSCLTMSSQALQYQNSIVHFAYLPYAKSLGYLKKSKTVLEIASPSDKGPIYTARVAQAFGEGKKLITNSRMLTREPFYRKANCILFDKATDINVEEIDTPFEEFEYDFSGVSMVEYVHKKLFS